MIFDDIKIGVILILRFLCFYQSIQDVISSKIYILEKSCFTAKIYHFLAFFLLGLHINVDKLHYNKINSMEALFFLYIKLAEIIKLIQYGI